MTNLLNQEDTVGYHGFGGNHEDIHMGSKFLKDLMQRSFGKYCSQIHKAQIIGESRQKTMILIST
jgi:hypothetical protein